MFENVTLELSLKPFKQTDEVYIRKICKGIFEQWRPLLKNRKTISVMLWVGDGSEILDYKGELSESFEWCRFVGTANLPHIDGNEPLETSLHKKKQDYISNAPVMTYAILKTIISCLKEEGRKAFPDAVVKVGETFDIGPEFAISDFKYSRHNEICSGSKLDIKYGFVDATALLHADDRYYAAYPNGIPEGTPFGTFLGKQSNVFLRDMGFDYLWLSNGLGFSADPWKKTGKIFDGENYYPEKLDDTKKKVFGFWKLFREACPDIPLEVRGTNNSVGIDYATDGVPLWDIYNANLNIIAPPNSPWAAINDNYGLEMMGHMTRICMLPNSWFPFRYYLHDPWWINSPWYDRYDGSPCDIYLPMSISRINQNGKVESANKFNILSIDNSYGELPDSCANEVIPHLLKAEKNVSDDVAPLVWVYPMREYTTTDKPELLKEMNLGDHYVCDAINDGFPLCCVTSTDNFLLHDDSIYNRSIIISPVPENPKVLDKLAKLSSTATGVIVYGTEARLSTVRDIPGLITVNSEGNPELMRAAVAKLGYEISFLKKADAVKPPAMSVSRYDNALLFSICNSNTTTVTKLKFPLGAPILCGMETEISDGVASYHFSRGEQRECRIFIEQTDGVISCHEAPPVNARFRRAIRIEGLNNATVRLFSELGCECAVSTMHTDATPVFDERFTPVYDEKHGMYLEGKNVNGTVYFLMGHLGMFIR